MNGSSSDKTAVRVLVVEDEPDSRNCLCKFLKARGYVCAGAANGAEALDLVSSFHPEAIIMDLVMPVLDGLEATRRLKADETTRGIPVLVLSGCNSREDRLEARLAGVDEYLTKPTNLDQLLLHLRLHARGKLSRL